MSFGVYRLRHGDLIAGGSGVLLLALMLLLKWYGSATGWQALSHLRWLVALTVLAALALVVLQATRRAPALPVSMSVIVTVLGLVTIAWLGYRVLISTPPHQKVGAYLGLACAVGIGSGGWASIRQEGLSPRDEVTEIKTISSETARTEG